MDRPCKNVDYKNTKYTVLEVISNYNYKLDTPPGIYSMFYVSLSKRTSRDSFLNQRQDNLQSPALMVDGEEEWEVKCVLKERVKGHQY